MEERGCRNCFYGKKLFAMRDILCQFNGVVNADGMCEHYQYNLFEKKPPKKRSVKQYKESQFQIDPENK